MVAVAAASAKTSPLFAGVNCWLQATAAAVAEALAKGLIQGESPVACGNSGCGGGDIGKDKGPTHWGSMLAS